MASQQENSSQRGRSLTPPRKSSSYEEMNSYQDEEPPTTRPRIYSEEDEEIRVAKAMALAIQNNPNMTPEEIRQLTADLQKQSRLELQQPEPATATGTSTTGGPSPNAIKNLLSDSISSTLRKSVFRDSTVASSSVSSSFAKEDDKQKRRSTLAKNAKNFRDKAKEKFKDIVKPSPSFDEEGINTVNSSSSPPTKDKPTATKSPISPLRSFGARNSVSNPQPPPSTPAAATTTTVPVLQEESMGSETTAASRAPSPTDSPSQDPRVRLTAILWKRRSGFGKLSSKNAWERRRVVLVGTKVSYFKSLDEVEAEQQEQQDDNVNPMELPTNDVPESDSAAAELSEGGGQRRATWLEQAAMNIEKARDNLQQMGGIMQNFEASNPPRGSLDLVKERAIVTATTGHSGAPSPFCISIKVRGGETKWKFCFDSHALQMEWLAALTDVVVTSSVDAYNAALVANADPTTCHDIGLFVAAPAEQEPEHDAAEGHRLWMMERYTITSQTGFGEDMIGEDDDDEDDDMDELDDSVGDVGMETMERGVLLSQTKSTTSRPLSVSRTGSWTLQDNNLYIMTLVVNVALFYSHASSTGIDKFWTVVTFVNMAFWLLVVKGVEDASAVRGSKALDVSEKTKAKRKSRKAVKGAPKVSPDYKPVAGTTTMLIENPTDIPSNKEGHIFAGWRVPSGSNLMVRSHGYLATKKKVPSPGELYTLARVDIFESRNQFRDMAKRVKLPKLRVVDNNEKKTWHAPDVFVISVALPTDPPKMGRSADDGGGYTITMYYTMKKETREILKRTTAPEYDASDEEQVDDIQKSRVNAVKLFNQWCRRAPTDPKFQARFKLIANAQNLKEIGMPNWIAKYNGKPVLIKRSGQTGFLYNHPELNAMEFDISLHPFPYLAKQAICYMKDSFFKKVLVTFGFVIEGRADDELPECLIGLMQLCYPDPKYAIQAEDFFSGTSPKSF